MKAISRIAAFLLLSLLVLQLAAAPVPKGKPEDVGMSLERLQRIEQMLERRIAKGEMSGAVAIVARKGKVVYLTARGVMDLETNSLLQPRCFVSHR
jgi:hypothetical protein